MSAEMTARRISASDMNGGEDIRAAVEHGTRNKVEGKGVDIGLSMADLMGLTTEAACSKGSVKAIPTAEEQAALDSQHIQTQEKFRPTLTQQEGEAGRDTYVASSLEDILYREAKLSGAAQQEQMEMDDVRVRQMRAAETSSPASKNITLTAENLTSLFK